VDALGIRAEPRVELRRIEIAPGNVFLLCTDGLTDMVGREEIERILVENENDLDAAARALVKRAIDPERYPPDNPGRGLSVGDNVTAVLVRFGPIPSR
jgi:PPM family protein phosphatase